MRVMTVISLARATELRHSLEWIHEKAKPPQTKASFAVSLLLDDAQNFTINGITLHATLITRPFPSPAVCHLRTGHRHIRSTLFIATKGLATSNSVCAACDCRSTCREVKNRKIIILLRSHETYWYVRSSHRKRKKEKKLPSWSQNFLLFFPL